MNILLPDSQTTGFMPPIFSAIEQYGGQLHHENADLPHPASLLSHSWSRVLKAAVKLIKNLELSREGDHEYSSELNDESVEYFRYLIYSSAEFIEDIEKNLPKTLSDKKKAPDLSGPGSHRKKITIPCNKLKHEHYRLQYFQAEFSGIISRGCCIFSAVKGDQHPNDKVFGREAISYNVEIRRIFAALYFYSQGAASKVSALSTEKTRQQCHFDKAHTATVLKRVCAMPIFSLPWEDSRHMPVLKLENNILTIEDQGGLVFAPVRCNLTLTTKLSISHKVRIPGWRARS